MKSFRYFIASLSMALLLGLSLTSCDDEAQAKNHQQEDVRGQNQEGDVNQAMLDSLSNFKTTIDSISQESKVAVEQVKTMHSSVSELKKKEIWIWIAIGSAIVLSLIIFGIMIRLFSNLQMRANRQRNDIIELQRQFQASSFASKPANRASTPSDYEYLKRRVYELETQIRQIASMMHTTQQMPQSPITTISSAVGSTPSNYGYFGNPVNATEPYFKKLLISLDSEARFSAEISGTKAIFKPLDSSSYLGTFVSNDAMRAAVTFTGCAPMEAASMQVIMSGEAMQQDNKWIITKKATVVLYR